LLLVEGIVDRIGRMLEHGLRQPDPGRVMRRAMRAVRDLLQSSTRKLPLKLDPGLLAWELAIRAGASKDLARDARLAMNFNDVAMAQFGAEIENQQRVLSPEETERLRNHPRVAASLLEDIHEMEDVSRIVLHHHERFDGSGYPDALSGDDIPLGARLVAIVDAFRSMTSPRKYKPTRTIGEAVEEIVHFSGRQFDPRLISHFVELLREKGWIGEDEAGRLIQRHARSLGEPVELAKPPLVPVLSADNQGEDDTG
jgi:response regulator RpfG family c-di-GMP phosphodiesterase